MTPAVAGDFVYTFVLSRRALSTKGLLCPQFGRHMQQQRFWRWLHDDGTSGYPSQTMFSLSDIRSRRLNQADNSGLNSMILLSLETLHLYILVVKHGDERDVPSTNINGVRVPSSTRFIQRCCYTKTGNPCRQPT